MATKATLQIVEIAKRIAANYGTSVEEVLDRWGRGLQNAAYSKRDFFWADGDISLRRQKLRSKPQSAKRRHTSRERLRKAAR